MRCCIFGFAVFLFAVQGTFATTRYVNANNTTPVSPYTSWATAATNIQDAINAAGFDETIWVADGTYQAGSVGNPYNSRIQTLGKRPIIQSVNGPEVTIIKGITNGASVLRCAYLTSSSVLSGFTLTNGNGPTGGGGVYCESSDCIVTNCIIVGNITTTSAGGGARGGTLINCLLTNNAGGVGGGTASNTLVNCTLINNTGARGAGASVCLLSNCLLVANISIASGNFGGGAANCLLYSCTISNNAAYNGGGVYFCTVNDSLISSNRASSVGGGEYLSVLSNCVVQNNFANGSGGAGAYQGALTNCILQNNVAAFDGAGANNSTLVNCTIASNTITSPSGPGGGAYTSALYGCLVVGNTASQGAGVYGGVAKNCTITGNIAATAPARGGGAAGAQLYNSIIYYNQASTNADTDNCPLTECCTSSLNYSSVYNSFTNEPLFVDPNSDFHLQSSSPCVNSGNNSYSINSPDLDGNQRIVGGTVDAGAYEFQSPASVISYAWLQQYGLPTDGSVDYSDDDTDGMNTWQEWMAGTDPTDASSLLQMQSAVPSVDFSSVAVSWQSVAGKTYFLQRSTNLPVFSTIQSNIIGQSGTTTYADTSAGTGSFFYRIAVQ